MSPINNIVQCFCCFSEFHEEEQGKKPDFKSKRKTDLDNFVFQEKKEEKIKDEE